ncbi:DUF732 domain-containing protein [Mycobacterium szulgai]|nr:DUF732 domain-containing protein [Mycobacterium szulgai]
MFTTRVTKSVAGTALVAGTVGLATLLSFGTANASSVDDQFVATLQQQGITVSNPQAAIKVGHKVCVALGEGTKPSAISAQLVKDNPGMSEQNSLVFVVDSVQSYCPQYMHHNADGTVTISAA